VRARRGWIAAVLLIALAFIGGPDALDTAPPPSQATIAAGEVAEKRDRQAPDDVDVQHQVADLGTPGHLRLSALPPSPHTAAPVPVRGATQVVPQVQSATVADVGRRPPLGASSPETLQIFRC